MRSNHTIQKNTFAGFSLVEVLITITIIVVLAALLTTGISGLRAKATVIKCTANLRSIQTAILTWTTDENGAFPYAYSYGPVLPGMPGQSAKNRNWSGQMIEREYLKDWDVFKCPAAPVEWSANPNSSNHYSWDGYSVHYAYNGYLSQPEGLPEAFPRRFFFGRLANVTSPHQTLMLVDAGFPNGDEPTRGFYLFYEGDRPHGRHQGKVNAAYVDGHIALVEKTTPKDTLNDPLGKYHIRKLD